MPSQTEHTPAPRRYALARKYRPKLLCDLVGQPILVETLERGIQERHLPQAILLHGIRGTGKTSTARILARALNCTGPDGKGEMTAEPCGICASCKALSEDRHPDVLEMDAASHTGVDDIRELIDTAQYKAILGRYKVFIIDEVHMLSKSAFNALLKTLEEPPQHVLFVFATTEIQKVPDTILSRCARFDLKRVPARALMQHFENIAKQEEAQVAPDALALLVRAADGSVRDGLTLLDQALSRLEPGAPRMITAEIVETMLGLTDRRQLYALIAALCARQTEQVIALARGLLQAGGDAIMLLRDLMEIVYHMACLQQVPQMTQEELIPEGELTSLKNLCSGLSPLQTLGLWKMLLSGYDDVKRSPFTAQALEMVLMRLTYAAALPPIEDLLRQTAPNISASPAIQPVVAPVQQPSPPEQTLPAQQFHGAHPAPDPATAPASATVIPSLEELLRALEADREVLLLNYLRKEMVVHSFSPGTVHLSARTNAAEKAVPLLKQFLHKKTGTTWEIMKEGSATSGQTIEEQEKERNAQKIASIQEGAFGQALQSQFPGADIQVD